MNIKVEIYNAHLVLIQNRNRESMSTKNRNNEGISTKYRNKRQFWE